MIKQQRKKTVAVFYSNGFCGHLHVTLHCVWEKNKGINFLSFQHKCHRNLFMVCVLYKKAPLEKKLQLNTMEAEQMFQTLPDKHTYRKDTEEKQKAAEHDDQQVIFTNASQSLFSRLL